MSISFLCSSSQLESYPACLSSPGRTLSFRPGPVPAEDAFLLLNLSSPRLRTVPLLSVLSPSTCRPVSSTPPTTPMSPVLHPVSLPPSPISSPSPPLPRSPFYIPPHLHLPGSVVSTVVFVMLLIGLICCWIVLTFKTITSLPERKPLSCWENQENQKPYTHQRAMPWDPIQRLQMEVWRFWQRKQAEHGLMMVQEAFEKVLSDLGSDLHHDMFGCKDCQWEGRDVIYCRWSWHHWDRPLHVCPGLGQECC